MIQTESASFRVPQEEASGLNSGQWVWDVAGWPGVKRAVLDGIDGSLSVEATPGAMRRVRRFCHDRGFREER